MQKNLFFCILLAWERRFMKQFKKSLLIIGLCFLMIGCTNDAMSKVTKKLQDAGYDISYLT